VLAEAVRDKKLSESPCAGIQLPGVVTASGFIPPAHAQIGALAAGLPPDWAATVWRMHGCGPRIGEALAVSLRCRINRGKTLRVREQVDPSAQLRPLKFTTPDGYLFQGRKYKLVVRRSYQQDFQRSAARAGLPSDFIPHSLRHLHASTALAEGIPITEVSRWLGHKSIEVTYQIYTSCPARSTAPAPHSTPPTTRAVSHPLPEARRDPDPVRSVHRNPLALGRQASSDTAAGHDPLLLGTRVPATLIPLSY
jgi:Phage integrase family